MPKGYVVSYNPGVKEKHGTDVTFSLQSKNAMVWNCEEKAQNACAGFNKLRIALLAIAETERVCEDFKVEKLGEGKFVVFCEGPFTPTLMPQR